MDTTILIIAASDSCAGAGVEIDLKRRGSRRDGTCAITGVTAQNTYEVTAIQTIEPSVVRAQIDAVRRYATCGHQNRHAGRCRRGADGRRRPRSASGCARGT